MEVAMEGNTTELYGWNTTREGNSYKPATGEPGISLPVISTEREPESRPAAVGSNSRSTTKERTATIPIEVLVSWPCTCN